MSDSLAAHRERIDDIDRRLLDLLKDRADVAAQVIAAKIAANLPIFVPERETDKITAFRNGAAARDLDADWAEDLLRLVMSASRAAQSQAEVPRATPEPRTVLVVGGLGSLGSLYARTFTASGHEVRVLDVDDWDRADELAAGADVAVVVVPIRETLDVIDKLAPHLGPTTVLCDFTSHKTSPLQRMLAVHPGPVVGLHPMHGAEVENLSKQLMIVCPGRMPEATEWLLRQFQLWGLRLKELDPRRHDEAMHLVQGLRHFAALTHGSFMRTRDMRPADILELSSPIYRAELMMTGRIFAQSAELYADIVFSDKERRDLLQSFLDHSGRLAQLVREDDKAGFIAEFQAIGDFFGEFADQALRESGYLIHRLADRFE